MSNQEKSIREKEEKKVEKEEEEEEEEEEEQSSSSPTPIRLNIQQNETVIPREMAFKLPLDSADVEECQYCGLAFSFSRVVGHCQKCGQVCCSSCLITKKHSPYLPSTPSTSFYCPRCADYQQENSNCPLCLKGWKEWKDLNSTHKQQLLSQLELLQNSISQLEKMQASLSSSSLSLLSTSTSHDNTKTNHNNSQTETLN